MTTLIKFDEMVWSCLLTYKYELLLLKDVITINCLYKSALYKVLTLYYIYYGISIIN